MEANQEALNVIIKGIAKMLNDFKQKEATQIYDGLVVSQGDSNKWEIKYNGKTHLLKHYGNITPSVNKIVKVFIPQGNQNLAFFI